MCKIFFGAVIFASVLTRAGFWQVGRAGYPVIAPLRMEGSDAVVLVNRDWIEMGHDRNVLPEPALVIEVTAFAEAFLQ